jgi:tRNA(Ile)-lysidine synthase TilS/MesJ
MDQEETLEYCQRLISRTAELTGSEPSKDIPIYLICYTGLKSDIVSDKMQSLGYECYSLAEGYRCIMRRNVQRYLQSSKEAISENNEQYIKDVERSLVKKFRKDIWCKFTKAINEYELIQDGDRIAVCISGGKDSMLMAKLFQELYRHGIKNFEPVFLVMNPGYNDMNYQVILDNAKKLGIPIEVFKTDILDSVAEVGDNPCYLCARMRRGYLYSQAKELGCNKIALGHHFDDVIEAILMGMLWGGQIQTMMPKLHSTNFEGMELIRPMYFIREDDIKAWRDQNDLHFIQCACHFTDTCSSCRDEDVSISKRMETKKLIRKLKETNPYVEANIFNSVSNVSINALPAYKKDGIRHNFLEDY